jgi:imidazolonepropionase
VDDLRAAGDEAIAAHVRAHLRGFLAAGTTTVECKSGYGLDLDAELKLLRVYRRLAAEQPVRIVSTFLGAHIVPAEFRDDPDRYVALLVERMIPAVAQEKLAACCDVFVEESAFTLSQARRILRAARQAGLAAKLHADQLTSCGGAELAAELGALSADHLEHISDAGITAMAGARVVAVSLPLASLYLRQPPMPARRLIQAGVPVAVATDFNPGSAPSYHLPLAMMLACTLQSMTPGEVLKGATIYAARAVGMDETTGSLEPGKAADFAIIDAPDVNHWLYHFRPNACVRTVIAGSTRWTAAIYDTTHSS